MAKFRASDLAKTIPAAYRVVGTPKICTYDMLFPLRDVALPAVETEAA